MHWVSPIFSLKNAQKGRGLKNLRRFIQAILMLAILQLQSLCAQQRERSYTESSLLLHLHIHMLVQVDNNNRLKQDNAIDKQFLCTKGRISNAKSYRSPVAKEHIVERSKRNFSESWEKWETESTGLWICVHLIRSILKFKKKK